MPPIMCKSCCKKPAVNRGGYCDRCKRRQKRMGKPPIDRGDNMTAEEVDRLVEEQYRNLPDWWPDEIPFSKDDK